MSRPQERHQATAQAPIDEPLAAAYREQAAPLVEAFLAHLTSRPRPNAGEVGDEDAKVGLLTFPNSGTTWTLQLVERATGICRHTVYEKEAVSERGVPNRGVFALQGEGARLPEPHEPALVKDHVHKYGDYPVEDIAPSTVDAVFQRWSRHLSSSYRRHVRLVRNPFDNLSARFRFHQKNRLSKPGVKDLPFKDYIREDLPRYLLWHACCNRVPETPLLTLPYERLLGSCATELRTLLEYCGFAVEDERVEQAAAEHPPLYRREIALPNHLGHFSVEDVYWVSEQLRHWLDAL